MTWAMSWTELNGTLEVKTPVFKMCVRIESNTGPRRIMRAGTATVEGSLAGLCFPYLPPARSRRSIREQVL
jgi:hypothetical protein